MRSCPRITFLSQNLESHQSLIDSLKPWVGRIQSFSALKLPEEADVVLIEAAFPFSKTYKFLKHLQDGQSTACIILMGPDLDAPRVSALLQVGVFDYLKTPVPPRRLRKAIHKGLKNRESLFKILKLSRDLELANQSLSEERDQLKRLNSDLSQLYALNQRLSESLRIEEVLRSFTDHVKKVTSCDIIALYLQGWKQVYLEGDRARWKELIEEIIEETRQEGLLFSRSGRNLSRPLLRSDGREISLPLQIGTNKVGLLRMLHIPKPLASSLHAIPRNSAASDRQAHTAPRFSHHHLKLVSMTAAPLAVAIRNAEMFRQVEELAVKDALTGVLNRRAFSSILEREFLRADRYHTPLSLMVIDLDHFKRVNDSYGHLAGDQVLQEIARIFSESLRDIDVLIRYGGEEFVVILPGTSLRKGLVVAKRIKERVEAAVFHEQDPIKMTVSIGLADTPAAEVNTPEALFQRADQALYAAKRNGRNLIMTPDQASSPWQSLALEGKGAA